MSKINEYPQAVTINNNDLFVIDQESGGDHATKSASVSQIADKATSGVQTQIGDLSQLTTSVTSSLVGAVNSLNSVTSGTVTPQTGYTDNGSYIKKCGNLVLVHINLQASTPINNRTMVGTLHGAGMLPPDIMRFCGCASVTHNDFLKLIITGYIHTNGSIYIGDNLLNSSTSATDLFADISYFV